MKKILMIVMLLLGLGGAGAGYYLFYYQPMHELAEAAKAGQKDTPAPQETESQPGQPDVPKPEVMDYFVELPKLGVREAPNEDAFVERWMYRGDKVHLYEKKDGWGRVSQYFVYQEGGPEIAEWLPLSGLSEQAPVITADERNKTLAAYIAKSDDLLEFESIFLQKTDQLLKEGTCDPDDFAELGGWVRSVKFQNRDVYFIYCGGLSQADKIYLNVQTGEIFYNAQ
ncbi:hypothetical protein [Vibrio ostreae]|uniref:Uncharacterized protein n=1 Tax=Vibrio ostreae TaxID=2841925 RepID=A0A975U744_9VIBR|nr:hypothetical protein [Vibrio ostreae]QXO16358.1 hypothetical protein KNV97_02275 [Vibrio ostreae]